MRRAIAAVATVVLGAMMVAPAAAASSSPAQSNQAAPQQDGSAQNQVQSQPLSPQAEAALAKKVVHAILMLPYYGVFDSIGFQVQGRTVILTGQVLRSSLKPDAQNAVKKIEGVEKVVNNIEVLPVGSIDMRIREQVRQAIYGYGPFLKYANQPIPPIRIIVKNARVTLEGVVDNETDKGQATMRANQVPNVLSVTNDLRVAKS